MNRSVVGRLRRVWARSIVLVLLVAGPARAGGPLDRSVEDFDFVSNPELLQRILDSPYDYFRFTNLPFATEVCARFADALPVLPTVNLHGDAHLEQYAITDVGYGLSDFDDACSGPAVLDLVRFGTSIVLACESRGWEEHTDALLEHFLASYQRALLEPEVRAPVPSFVDGVVEGFSPSRRPFLEWVETLLEPIDADDAEVLFAGFERYRAMVRERNPRLRPGFFDVRSAGRVRIGVGSALDRKFLLRVAGPTDGEDDDVVLEVREVRDLSAIPCIRSGQGAGAFRILLGYSRIGSVPFDFIAPLPRGADDPLDEAEFWVHSWQAHYHELDVEDDPLLPEQLAELIEDAAFKLAHGHVVEIADPHEFTLRHMARSLVGRFAPALREAAHDMARETTESWRRFVREVEDGAPGSP